MHGPMIRESRTRSCSCRTARTGTRMDQATGSPRSNLQLLLCLSHDEKQRCRYRERSRDTGKLRLRESTGGILPGICFLNLLFKVSRPGISHQQPHQQRRGYGEASLIEESDRDETKNQTGESPANEI